MRFVFDIDGTLCFDGRLIDQTIIDITNTFFLHENGACICNLHIKNQRSL
ncbi:TPA: hypothetical protein PC777_001674 [Staphylococcus aureus]|nr:hypothetical protein [Staphylococcus aureus]HDE5392358.1 hypothetical protein [Staphylococcus aureus]HDE9452071.1 hypothetical protein [Staphylococcus aureus]HDF0399418.1 hypothetical protein [Staphylococcus aureus]HDF1682949.1 hypothetical protein [Staphylococcus aureus]